MHFSATDRTINAQFYFILNRCIITSMYRAISTTPKWGTVMTKAKQ